MWALVHDGVIYASLDCQTWNKFIKIAPFYLYYIESTGIFFKI